ncbi:MULTISPECIES: 2-dehydro-3-deoxygalactonokinase [unclassified Roseovarius]|uniref:2-dehydro-3-deoxygalactonokinase n=1 Tax=unclassified Roseovarius TaxID=2614913 RepID=UPI00273EA0F8|nr:MULTISPECIES: 2-dehydro-3-deoxygalactonokinase [unclassified Roseovarius]
MADTSWIAIGRDAEGFRAFAVEGSEVKTEARAETEDQAYARLGFTAQSIRWIGEGTPDVTPCAVLPPAGRTLPVVTQEQPADVLGAWPRLWVAGFLAGHENWDGVLCIETGDASHWVHVGANEIISFASFLSLRLATFLGGGYTADPAAMADSQSRPERLASHLRQAEIAGNPAAITGHLIGAELAAARVYWLGQQVGVIAPQGEASIYARVLAAQGVPVVSATPDDMVQVGLAAMARALRLVAVDPD